MYLSVILSDRHTFGLCLVFAGSRNRISRSLRTSNVNPRGHTRKQFEYMESYLEAQGSVEIQHHWCFFFFSLNGE